VVLVFNFQYSSDTSVGQILQGVLGAFNSIGVGYSAIALIGYLKKGISPFACDPFAGAAN